MVARDSAQVQQETQYLEEDRTTVGAAFEVISTDFAGPV